jgi:hypothetical protein
MSFETFIKSQLYKKRSPNLVKLGFDFSNQNVHEEYHKIQEMLFTEYHIKHGSMITIMDQFKIPSTRTIDTLFREFEIKSRTLSEATSNAYEQNRVNVPPIKFHNIWHKTWMGNSVLLRSSYEKQFALLLDEIQEEYHVEAMRIKYFNKREDKFKIAIPDFYLPKENKIVEIKSTYWLDDSMKDKKEAYESLGYKFSLYLDGKIVDSW